MATLDKEIKVIAVKGQRGYSSYEEAVANDYFSGTLEEWIETYATPENYVTRDEFKKVTQAEYDALEQAGELIPNCYYIITDDETYDELITRLNGIDTTITEIDNQITEIDNRVLAIENKKIGTDISFSETEITINEAGLYAISFKQYEWESSQKVLICSIANISQNYVFYGIVSNITFVYDGSTHKLTREDDGAMIFYDCKLITKY